MAKFKEGDEFRNFEKIIFVVEVRENCDENGTTDQFYLMRNADNKYKPDSLVLESSLISDFVHSNYEEKPDPVNHPTHYTNHPSGIECIQITEHMGFNLGNVVKYAWRCDLKLDAIEDLEKAEFYLKREIEKRKAAV